MSIIQPNLLLVGAAKSGTTSLYQHLSNSKSIFFPETKEPKYFTKKNNEYSKLGPGDKWAMKDSVETLKEYYDLFKNGKNYKYVAEASADYLYYHKESIPEIKALLGDPTIIIVLRNPVSRAFSAYGHLRRDSRESCSFEKGLELEPQRIKNGFEFLWHYKSVGLYYEQVKAFKANFSNCYTFFFEDFKSNPEIILDEISDLLKIEKIPIGNNNIYNESGIVVNHWKPKLYNYLLKVSISKSILNLFPTNVRKGIKDKFRRTFLDNYLQKIEIKQETKSELTEFYKEDVEKLGILLGLDLRKKWF
jgi:hypothetical protein